MIAFIILGFGEVAILMRTGMAEEASEDYVKTAYAKGLPGRWCETATWRATPCSRA